MPLLVEALCTVFDVDANLLEGEEPLAVVRWSHATGASPPAAKRAKGAAAAAPWGEQAAVTRLASGCTESVFMLALARDAQEGDIHCGIEWNAAPPPTERPLAGLRYAIYAHLATDAPYAYYRPSTALPTTHPAYYYAPSQACA